MICANFYCFSYSCSFFTLDLVPCENVGPITDWWFEGFDPNDESSLGLTTEKAHYYLETPMAEYVPFMASVKEKIYVAKIVIDVMEDVSDDVELSYDGLLDTLKVRCEYCLDSYNLEKIILFCFHCRIKFLPKVFRL